MPEPPRQRDKVFISYSHKDAAWLERLQVSLKPQQRQGLLDPWDDTRIGPGDDWEEQIRKAMASARVAILLVSPDFLASDFIMETEVPALLQAARTENLRIIPVILKECGFQRTPELSHLQAVNPVSRPVNAMPAAEQDTLWERLARQVEEALRGGSGRPTAARRELRGEFAYITCNRDAPTREFRGDMEDYLSGRSACCVQFYVIEGAKDDCAGSFVSRLSQYELKELASELGSTRWSGAPRVKDIDVGWECRPDVEIETSLGILQDNILRGAARNENLNTSTQPVGPDFHARLLRLLGGYHVVFIRHHVNAAEWHEGMKELLRAYVGLFSTVPAGAPLYVLFFTVERRPSNKLLGFFSKRRQEPALTTMEVQFREGTSRHDCMRFRVMRSLDEVDEQHVVRVLRNIYGEILDGPIQQRLRELFSRRRRITMREVEEWFSRGEEHPFADRGAENA